MADYSEITDPILQAKVRARYEHEITELQWQEFRHLAYYLEILGPYSAILQLPVLLLTLPKREVLAFPPPLRLAIANVLLAREDPPSIALCMGMGVKFYTRFTNGTLLISSTFQSYAQPKPYSSIAKSAPSPTIELAWASHRGRVNAAVARGDTVQPGLSFQAYVSFSLQEEDLSQYE